jgi:hypothetical protein
VRKALSEKQSGWPNDFLILGEEKMTRINKFVALFAFSLMALVLPSVASAQYNGGYGYPNGGYGNGGYGRDIRGSLDNLKNRARDFEHQVDRGRNSGVFGTWGGRGTDDRYLRSLADQFTDATKDLRNNYGRGRDLSGSSDEARRVLDIASQIDSEIYRAGVNREAQNLWNRMRYDLRLVADTYGYNGGYNNRYPRNNRNGGYGNGRNNPWPF